MKEPSKETVRLVRELSKPAIKASQKAYHQTAFCLTKTCPNSNYFTEYKDASSSLVDKIERRQFTFAHTIANKSQLADITEDQKLAWIPLRPAETWSTKPIYSFDTPSRVLAFRGFCRKCDNDLFLSIDRPLKKITPQVAFMLAYRSFAYKCWVDEAELNAERLLKTGQHEPLSEFAIDLGINYRTPERSEIYKKYQRKLSNLAIANIFQDGINNQQYQRLSTAIFEIDSALEYRFSCATGLTLDVTGQSIKMKWSDCLYEPLIFVHMLKVGSVSNLIVSWLDYIPDKFAERYLVAIQELNEKGDLPDTFIRYAIINNRGLAMRPSWLSSLPDEAKVQLSLPVVGKIYSGAKIPKAPTPTLGWSGDWRIDNQRKVETKISFNEELHAHYRTACIDAELDYPSNVQDMKHLLDRYSALFDSTWDYLDNHQLRDALFTSSEMLRIVCRLENVDIRQIKTSEAWKTFGCVAEAVGEFEVANQSYAQAGESLNSSNDEHRYALADLLNRHSNVLGILGRSSDSAKLANWAVEHWKKIKTTTDKYDIELAQAYSTLTLAFSLLEQHKNVKASANKVFELIDSNNIAHLELYARTKNNLAGSMTKTGDVVGAYNAGIDALKAYRQLAVDKPQYTHDVRELEGIMQELGRLYTQVLYKLTISSQK